MQLNLQTFLQTLPLYLFQVEVTYHYARTYIPFIEFKLSSLLLAPTCTLPNLLRCQAVREVMRGDVGPWGTDWVCLVSSWSEGLPLNLVLYMSFSIFAYSTYIFRANFDLIVSP